jgi:uncharacterized protein YnzC (UPF0291/DUF896 family)
VNNILEFAKMKKKKNFTKTYLSSHAKQKKVHLDNIRPAIKDKIYTNVKCITLVVRNTGPTRKAFFGRPRRD